MEQKQEYKNQSSGYDRRDFLKFTGLSILSGFISPFIDAAETFASVQKTTSLERIKATLPTKTGQLYFQLHSLSKDENIFNCYNDVKQKLAKNGLGKLEVCVSRIEKDQTTLYRLLVEAPKRSSVRKAEEEIKDLIGLEEVIHTYIQKPTDAIDANVKLIPNKTKITSEKKFLEDAVHYISERYLLYTGKEISQNNAFSYARSIYSHSKEFGVDPYIITSILGHETRFVNKIGDEHNYVRDEKNNKLIHNPSEGLGQMGRMTKKDVFRLLKRDNDLVRYDASNIQSALKNKGFIQKPDIAIMFSVKYYQEALRIHNGDVRKAVASYNGGFHFSRLRRDKRKKVLRYASEVLDEREQLKTGKVHST